MKKISFVFLAVGILAGVALPASAATYSFRFASRGLVSSTPAPVIAATTWDASGKSATTTLSADLLTATVPANKYARATVGKSTGKWYWEVIPNGDAGAATNGMIAGIMKSPAYDSYVGASTDGVGPMSWVSGNGYLCKNGCTGGAAYTWANFNNGNVLGFALDADAQTLKFYVGNTLRQTIAIPAGTWYPAVGGQYAGSYMGKFSASSFSYTPPAGYAPLE